MVNIGQPLKRNTFERIIAGHIKSQLEHGINPSIFIWNYNLEDINIKCNLPIHVMEPDFITLRKLQMRSFNPNEIIIIKDTVQVPIKILDDIINHMQEFKTTIIFSDNTDNIYKYPHDLISKCINFRVGYES